MATMNSGLGGSQGYGENSFKANGVDTGDLDDGAVNVDVSSVFSGGMNVAGSNYSSIWINSNGSITFGSAETSYLETVQSADNPMIAALLTDVDINDGGDIFWDLDPSAGTVTITWHEAAPYFGSGTNSFQVVLTDTGSGDFDVTFIYEDIQYSQGATAGFSDSSTWFALAGSGSNSAVEAYETTDFGGGDPAGVYTTSYSNGAPPELSGLGGLNVTDPSTGDDVLDGSDFDDTLTAADGNDTLNGGFGDDILIGGDDADTFNLGDDYGADTITGGEGGTDDDVLDFSTRTDGVSIRFTGDEEGTIREGAHFNSGEDDILGFSEIERFILTDHDDDANNAANSYDSRYIDGRGGDDSLSGSWGADTILGGAGNDSLWASDSGDSVAGGAGDDTVEGAWGDDTLSGGTGDDSIDGGDDADSILLEDAFGNDTIIGGEGGTDADVLDLSALTTGVTVAFSGDEAGTITDGTDTVSFSEIEQIILGDAAETVAAADLTSDIAIDAQAGDDSVTGGSGNDTLTGRTGDDSLAGGDGNDVLTGDQGNLIINGSFELDAQAIGGTPTGWVRGGIDNNSGINFDAARATDGVNAYAFGGWGSSIGNALSQDVPMEAGESYRLTFDTGATLGTVDQVIQVEVLDASSNVILDQTITVPAGTVTTQSLDFVSPTNGGTLRFTHIDGEEGDLDFDNVVLEAAGEDTLDGGAGDDTLYGGGGDDTLVAGDGADVLDGGEGNDALEAGPGAGDTLDGGEGDDTLVSGTGDDELTGGGGSNTFRMLDGFGNDTVLGSNLVDDTDVLDFSGVTGTSIHLDFSADVSAGTITDGSDTVAFSEVEHFVLTDQNDLVTTVWNTNSFTFDGAGGNDTISGSRGDHTILGGSGDDVIYGGQGQSSIDGGTGNDTVHANFYSVAAKPNSYAGGDDIDTFAIAGTPVDAYSYNIDLIAGSDQYNNAYSGFENILGGSGDDTLSGGTENNMFEGGIGADRLYGDGGSDTLIGGSGDDSLEGGDGADFLKTGSGQDTAIGGDGNDTLMNAAGDDSLVGGAGDDSIVATAGRDTLEGGSGNDTLMGGTDGDSLDGGADDDLLLGDLAGVRFNETGTDGVGLASNLTDFPSTDLSYEITFASVDASGFTPLASYAVSNAQNNEFLIAADGGQIRVFIDGVVTDTGVPLTTLFDGSTHTLAVTWSSATGALELYVDGVSTYSGTHVSGGTLEPGGTLALGQEQDSLGGGFSGSQIFDGTIYGVRLYDDIRTPAEIEASSLGPVADTSDPALVANWVADPATGGFTDQTGSHPMTMSGDTALTWSAGADTLDGGAGDDTIYGGGGDDLIDGGAGSDNLSGDDGGDTISGGLGGDAISGGAGDDVALGDARLLDVPNHSLEDHVHSDGGYSGGAPGWTFTGGAGDWNPLTSHFPDGEIDGDNVAYLHAGARGTTTLSETYDSTQTYSLYLDIGARAGYQPQDFTVNIFAGSTVVGTFSGSTAEGGGVLDAVFVDTMGTSNPALDGQTLSIEIVNDGSQQINFDNLRLTAEATSGVDAGADTLTGGDGGDLLAGGAGDDDLSGDGGDDTLDGGAGADTLRGGAGDDTLTAGAGADSLSGGDDADRFILGDSFGNDTITGGEGGTDEDVLDLSALTTGVTVNYTGDEAGTITDGTDTLTFSEIERIILGDQADVVDAMSDGAGINVHLGGGADSLDAGTGNNTITGGAGDDTVNGNIGDDSIDGGDGDDVIRGVAGNNTLEGGAGNDSLQAGFGNNTLSGGSGDDTLVAVGASTLSGGADDDLFLSGSFADSIEGGDGADTVIISDGFFGNDTIAGGEGGTDDDVLDLSALTTGVTVNYTGDEAGTITDGTDTLTFSEIERIILTDQNDSVDASSDTLGVDITDTGGDDTITTGSGNDTITDQDGNNSRDVIDAGSGDDSIFAGGFDTVHGGSGHDTISMEYSYGGNEAHGGQGNDSLTGANGNQALYGGEGNDTIRGGNDGSTHDSDTLDGGDGDDYIESGTTATPNDASWQTHGDSLSGGQGNDTIIGGAADDTISGGTGNDSMEGGEGADTFIVQDGFGNDTIIGGEGSSPGDNADVLDLSALTTGVTVNYTGEEAGTITDGTDTLSFAEIERIILGDEADVVDGTSLVAGEDMIVDAGGGNDTIAGGAGGDSIDGGLGDDSIDGGAGDDTIFDGDTASADWIDGGTGNDSITVSGRDTVYGGEGDDTVTLKWSNFGVNHAYGEEGDDSLAGTNGSQYLDGGDGNDTLTGGSDGGTQDADTLIGGAGDDSISSGFTNAAQATWLGDVLQGGTGNDTLEGGAARDSIEGGADDDVITGGGGDDTIAGGSGDDQISGGDDADTFVIEDGFGNDTIIGGEGGTDADILDLSALTNGVTVNYTGDESGTITDGTHTLTFSEIERIILTDQDDRFTWPNPSIEPINVDAGGGDDLIYGGIASDSIVGGTGADMLYGEEGDDTLAGGDGADTLYAGSGNDSVLGGDGDDELYIGTGNSTMDGGTGDDFLEVDTGDGTVTAIGGDGDDELDFDASNSGEAVNVVFTGDGAGTFITTGTASGTFSGIEDIGGTTGDDTMDASASSTSVTLDAGSGSDVLIGGANDDRLDGDSGDDTLIGGAGADSLTGDDGQDTLRGGAGDDTIEGGDDADTFIIEDSFGNDTILGGEGGVDADVLDLSALTTGVTVAYSGAEAGTITDGTDTISFSEIERIILGDQADVVDASGQSGTTGIDVITGDGDDTITGGNNADTIDAGDGDDQITAGSGADSVDGGDGADTITGDGGTDTIDGGDGADSIDGGGSADLLDGGQGNDTILGGGGQDTIDGGNDNDSIDGGAADDSIAGGNGADTLLGDAGADTLEGGNDADSLDGGDGDDALMGGAGNDFIDGGGGSDTFFVEDGFGSDVIMGGESAADEDVLDLSALNFDVTVDYTGDEAGTITDGTDTLSFSQIERIILGDQNDFLDAGEDDLGIEADGGAGNDSLIGGDGADLLSGGHGQDTLIGGAGSDTILGGADADTLNGGLGDDSLTGGDGDDVYVFLDGGGRDTIADFDISDTDSDGNYNDQLDLSGITRLDGNPINAGDVVVTDDGFGNAVLSFPRGEQLVLEGVSPAQMSSPSQMHAAGVPCFTRGARIDTARGPIPVEAIRPGDHVLTRDHGAQEVLWVSQSHIPAHALTQDAALRPIRLLPGALGNAREMLVSRQHCFVVDERHGLSGEFLARGRLLRRTPLAEVAEDMPGVTYFHILCRRHEIITADGVATETFYPGPMALKMLSPTALAELTAIFPGLDTATSVDGLLGPRIREVADMRRLRRGFKSAGLWHPPQPADHKVTA